MFILQNMIGKKVFSADGEEIGVITRIERDDLGYEVVVVRTVFPELPELRVIGINLKKKKDPRGEVYYVLRVTPVKLRLLLRERRREKELREAEKKFLLREVEGKNRNSQAGMSDDQKGT